MRPRDFCHFRQALQPASGFQSLAVPRGRVRQRHPQPQLPALPARRRRASASPAPPRGAPRRRACSPARSAAQGYALPDAFEEDTPAWDEAVRALLPVYRDVDAHLDVYRLCESIVAHDEWLGIWRYHHVRVVERIIGAKMGTGGSKGVAYSRRPSPSVGSRSCGRSAARSTRRSSSGSTKRRAEPQPRLRRSQELARLLQPAALGFAPLPLILDAGLLVEAPVLQLLQHALSGEHPLELRHRAVDVVAIDAH